MTAHRRNKKGEPLNTGCAVPISRDVYERMWELYKKGMPAFRISKQLQVSHVTVRKYIDHGLPARGYEPLRKRLQDQNARARERLFTIHAKRQHEHYNKADGAFTAALGLATDCADIASKFLEERKKDKAGIRKADLRTLSGLLSVSREAHALMEGWRSTRKALVVGEDSENLLKDLEEFQATGQINANLRAKLGDLINGRLGVDGDHGQGPGDHGGKDGDDPDPETVDGQAALEGVLEGQGGQDEHGG